MNTIANFQAEQFYHIYNRSNNQEAIFKKPSHRPVFLNKVKSYISPFVYIHSYALLDNHFHFSIQIKSFDKIINAISDIPKKDRTVAMWEILDNADSERVSINDLVINQFKNMLISYAKGINQSMGRTGSLFQKKFKRSHYIPEAKFRKIQFYIHHNARLHELVNCFTDYPFHSYFEIIHNESSIIDINKVLEYYDDLADFKQVHELEISKLEYKQFEFMA